MARKNSLSVTMDCQNTKYWCWAAVAQCINAYYGKPSTQEQIATRHVGSPCSKDDHAVDAADCTGTPCKGCCNSPHKLSVVLKNENHQVTARRIQALNYQEVVKAIDSDKPVPIRIGYPPEHKAGHFVCIIGYADDENGNKFVVILDPIVPHVGDGQAVLRDIPFDTLTTAYSVNNDVGTPDYIYELS